MVVDHQHISLQVSIPNMKGVAHQGQVQYWGVGERERKGGSKLVISHIFLLPVSAVHFCLTGSRIFVLFLFALPFLSPPTSHRVPITPVVPAVVSATSNPLTVNVALNNHLLDNKLCLSLQ